MIVEYPEKNYDRFFTVYTSLVPSSNYLVKRQSLKSLGEILLDRMNFNVMTGYTSNETKTKTNVLIINSKNIQFEAFHVFKVHRFPVPLTHLSDVRY
jgi:calcium binding protein 39